MRNKIKTSAEILAEGQAKDRAEGLQPAGMGVVSIPAVDLWPEITPLNTELPEVMPFN
jgi:hypothetical protein